jgi:Rrf2 family protein
MVLRLTTEYALSILGFMATRNRDLYPAEYLFEHLHIPRQYLRRLLTDLSKKGFITSTRGRYGGFIFARDLRGLTFYEVIGAMEGTESFNICLMGFSACIVDKPCAMHNLWTEAQSKMIDTLTKTTFADLREKYLKDNDTFIYSR